MNIGIIGQNEGNGHPYSFSAIFNGYDKKNLIRHCPFNLIKEYLPKYQTRNNIIKKAKVTHIWTQDNLISKKIAKVSNIQNIVDDYKDMVNNVDGLILARDDPWNHLEMIKPFIKNKIPVFIDKQLTSNLKDLKKFISMTGENYPLMAGSSIRYTKELNNIKKLKSLKKVVSIHGMSKVSWMRYGHHLFEGIAILWGLDIKYVKCLEISNVHEIIIIRYNNGLNVTLEFIREISLPIYFKCYFSHKEYIKNDYVVQFSDYYNSFRKMMLNFTNMIETGKAPVKFAEVINISKVILAGDISKKMSGQKINPQNLKPIN